MSITWPDDLFWIPPFLKREVDPDAPPVVRAPIEEAPKQYIPLGLPITGRRGNPKAVAAMAALEEDNDDEDEDEDE